MKEVFAGFREFIVRGNVIDLAVAVVIGTAFTALVNSVVSGLITPLIGALGGNPDFSGFEFTVNGSVFDIGAVLNAMISFVIVAAVIYFMIVLPMNKIMDKVKKGEKPADPSTKLCPECLSEVPLKAKKCKFCTSAIKTA